MPNYYEMLNVSPTATVEEIEVAYEQQYNRWRRLVTHHDPDTVNKANQALRWLEKAHATLADPTLREKYDVSIGLRGSVGGIADPAIASRPAPTAPPRPRTVAVPQSVSAAAQRVDAWVCPKCQTPNAVGTRFCERCGETLAQECPNCASWIKAHAVFCPECGTNVPELYQRREQERLRQEKLCAQMEALRGQIEQLVAQKRPLPQPGGWVVFGQGMLTLFAFLGIFAGIGLFVIAFTEGQFWSIPAGILCGLLGGGGIVFSRGWQKKIRARGKPIREWNDQLDQQAAKQRSEIARLQNWLNSRE